MAFGRQRREKAGKRKPVSKPVGPAVWFALVGLLVLMTASATGVIYTTHKNRHLLNELQQLERQRNALQVAWGQLLLEQSSLVVQGRIENLAIAELGMKIPATEKVVVVRSD
ncbi:MAG: cell division protein FtsL [Pseudohongiellaceae bacterium]|jgi:cell division protein FtsL